MDGWEEIEIFAEAHQDWLQGKGLFPEGVPVHDTIARVVSSIEPSQFQRSFMQWMQAANKHAEGALIAIDGKVLRGSYHCKDRKSAIHMVSAFAVANGVVMGQVKTKNKSNEIKAIPELLKLLDVKGCLVSIDAMGCQTDIASQIVAQGGDYLLAVKDNQENLATAVKKALRIVMLKSQEIQIEQGHGRIEAREYHVLPAAEIAAEFPAWSELKNIGVAIGYRRDPTGNESLDYRYYISSAELTPERFADGVRKHWEIENRLHWVLDVTMKEDACQIYRGAEVLAGVRHMALNMLRLETSKKASIRRKQKLAAMDIGYLERVVLAGINGVSKN